jgi:hypothetical protein
VKPNPTFLKQPKSFWAHVRSISQQAGYTVRMQNKIKVPSGLEMREALQKLNLDGSRLANDRGIMTELGQTLHDYFTYRADILNTTVSTHLMDAKEAQRHFKKIKSKAPYKCPFPMNKQKGTKANHAYLTGMVNMLVESGIGIHSCDYDPRMLTTVTDGSAPLRTLARRVDGAFPSSVNPVAIWEVKEYYYTTTFGSRIADGIYETLLDGMEIEELQQSEKIDIKHY